MLTGEKPILEGSYAIYADEVIDHLAKVGAEPILAGDVQRLILGEVDELWDVIAIVRYQAEKQCIKWLRIKNIWKVKSIGRPA